MSTPIILVCGPAGSGKDTVASIIAKKHNGVCIALADPMKRLAADVFGFTEEQLWGPSEFRNAPDERYTSIDAWRCAERRLADVLHDWLAKVLPSRPEQVGPLRDLVNSWFYYLWANHHEVPIDAIATPMGAAWINLSQGRRALVDSDRATELSEYCWQYAVKKPGYAGYAKTDIDGKTTAMHRMVLRVSDSRIHVDHINGITLDNRASNLRVATVQENHFNTAAKGYCWDKDRGKWLAKITVNGKTINLGRFDSEREARAAYDAARSQYFGEFARSRGLTPRIVLQTLGTEVGRSIERNIWIDAGMRTATALLGGGVKYDRKFGILPGDSSPDYILITDGRFRNEVVRVLMAGGTTLRIQPVAAANDAERTQAAGVVGHASEKELGGIPRHFYSYVVENDKSLGMPVLENRLKWLMKFLQGDATSDIGRHLDYNATKVA